jgi:hypothetical protein
MSDKNSKLTDAELAIWRRNVEHWAEKSEQELPRTIDPVPMITAKVLEIAKKRKSED